MITQRRCALHKLLQRLAHGRKILVQIRRHVGQLALRRLGRQAQADSDLVDLLQRLRHLGLAHLELLQSLVVVGLADRLSRQQPLGTLDVGPRQFERGFLAFVGGHASPQFCNLVVDQFDRVLQLETIASSLRGIAAHLVHGRQHIGPGQFHRGLFQIALNLVRLLVELNQ